jgi:hypothetical protein
MTSLIYSGQGENLASGYVIIFFGRGVPSVLRAPSMHPTRSSSSLPPLSVNGSTQAGNGTSQYTSQRSSNDGNVLVVSTSIIGVVIFAAAFVVIFRNVSKRCRSKRIYDSSLLERYEISDENDIESQRVCDLAYVSQFRKKMAHDDRSGGATVSDGIWGLNLRFLGSLSSGIVYGTPTAASVSSTTSLYASPWDVTCAPSLLPGSTIYTEPSPFLPRTSKVGHSFTGRLQSRFFSREWSRRQWEESSVSSERSSEASDSSTGTVIMITVSCPSRARHPVRHTHSNPTLRLPPEKYEPVTSKTCSF